MTALKKTAAVIAAVLLLFALLVVALNGIFNRTGWLFKEYLCDLDNSVKEEYGISAEDASRVLGRMMHYSIGRADDLDVTIIENGREVRFFNERELSHMRDVRRLAVTVMFMGLAALILAVLAIVLLAAFGQRDALRTFAKAYLIALGVLLAVVIALGIWIAIDFDSFWTMFHVVFLDLESSTFDPATSRMIRICPPELFSDFIARFAADAGLLAGAAAIVCGLYLGFSGKGKKRG
jgi:integral membrane protein (TIGR01906 family)